MLYEQAKHRFYGARVRNFMHTCTLKLLHTIINLCSTMYAHKLHYIVFIKVGMAHERLDYKSYNKSIKDMNSCILRD